MKMTLESQRNEELKWQEMKIELDWLSKEWDIKFIEYLGNWKMQIVNQIGRKNELSK